MATGMATATDTKKKRAKRGVHPPDRKELSADSPIEVLPTPKQLVVPLHQHIGAPAKATVKPRAELQAGDRIAEAQGMVSANVHSPVAGTAGVATAVTLPMGLRTQALPITPAEPGSTDDTFAQLFAPPWDLEQVERLESQQIIEAVRAAGIVGMGGATFPTHVKLMPQPNRPIDILIGNGCECEPYLTADYRLMVEAPEAVVAGLLLARKACLASRIYIAIEDNKPAAIESMRRATEGLKDVEVVVCETRYPMGGERQLIPTVTGRVVPTGGLPLDVGVVVVNVGTAAAIAAACLRNRPLTHRIVSVTGGGIKRPANLLVPIGTPIADLIEHCGGLTDDASRIIAGGPMMGYAVSDLSTPVTKGTSGITVLSRREIDDAEQTNCVRCGRCSDVCPLHLVPTRIAHAVKVGNLEMARKFHLTACVECGCCTYACPARIPLVQYIRVGKAMVRKQAASSGKS